MTAIAAALAVFGVLDTEPTAKERQIIDRAMQCSNAREPDPWLLWQLLEIEERAALPPELAGLTLAAACTESGYNPTARGDCKRGKCRARGMFQLWPWWVKRYRISRDNPLASAVAWLAHVVRQVPKTRKACPRLTGAALWRAAQVRAVRAPRGPRCNQRSLHWKRWRRWRATLGKI